VAVVDIVTIMSSTAANSLLLALCVLSALLTTALGRQVDFQRRSKFEFIVLNGVCLFVCLSAQKLAECRLLFALAIDSREHGWSKISLTIIRAKTDIKSLARIVQFYRIMQVTVHVCA